MVFSPKQVTGHLRRVGPQHGVKLKLGHAPLGRADHDRAGHGQGEHAVGRAAQLRAHAHQHADVAAQHLQRLMRLHSAAGCLHL